MRRNCVMLLAVLCTIGIISGAVYSAVPMLLTHQGRLLDGSNNPVSGMRDLTFRIYETETGGSPLWSESHLSVPVTNGLYSVTLGSTVGITGDLVVTAGTLGTERFLEIEVQNDGPMSPRRRLTASAYSVASSRVSGDVYTSPGDLLLDDGSGNTLEIGLQPIGGDILFHHNGVELASLTVSDTGSALKLTKNGSMPSPGHTTRVIMVAADSVIDVLDTDSDGDGIAEGEASLKVTPTTSSVAIKTKGTGADPNRVTSTTDDTTATVQLSSDSGTITMSVTPTTSSVAIKTKGTGADKDRVVSSGDDTTATVQLSSDSGTIVMSVTPTTSRMAIKTKGTGAQRIRAGGDCDDLDAQLFAEIDLDGDGTPEIGTEISANESRNILKTYFESAVIPTESQFLVVTDSTGLVSSSAVDLDGDGNPESSAKTTVTADAVQNYLDIDSDDDGIADSEASLRVTPTTSRMAIKTKGTGAQRIQAGGDCDDDAAQLHAEIDLDGDGLSDVVILEACTIDSAYESTTFNYPNAFAPSSVTGETKTAKQKKWLSSNFRLDLASRTAVDVSCDSATASSVWSADDFSGLPATSLSIQASTDPLVNPIDHSSGAHLTPGGSWTNSSDENLKENFQTIDGEELLNKIDELDINEWNYKSESDNVKHIGPTAQDFEKTFGLGSDGRSISTIDPSGIALAAIKALHEKSKRVDTLEKEVAELKLLVESMINNQATEK